MYEGRRVRLRALEPDDVPAEMPFVNDPEVVAHLMLRYPSAPADVHEYVAQVHDLRYPELRNFAIEDRASGRLLGGCGFHVVEPENGVAELGMMIGAKDVWGRGYGTDAIRVLCRVGFDEARLHKIRLHVYEGNERALRLYLRVGFVVEARAREARFARGKWEDAIHMGLLRGELREEDP